MAEVVDILRDTARAAVGAEGVAVIVDGKGRCSCVAEEAVAPLWQGQSFPADTSISGWAMHHGETVAISDVRLDPRIPQDAYTPTFVRSLVMVPIGRPTPVAALAAYWSTVSTHDRGTIERLESLARLATIAIENARLSEARNRAAALGAVQNRILELAVSDVPLADALESIIREVERASSSDLLGSILLLDQSGKHLRHGSAPSLPAAYNDAIDGIAIGPNAGSCGTAAFQQAPVFASDIATDPRWADFRGLALHHGLRACWSIPFRSMAGDVLGTFAMYHRQPREPQPEDLALTDFVTRSVALLLQRERASTTLHDSEARMVFALKAGRLGAWELDVASGELITSATCRSNFGRGVEDPFTYDQLRAAVHPDDQSRMVAAVQRSLATGEVYDIEYRIITPAGDIRWIQIRAKPTGAGDGSLRMVGVSLDVTQRREAESALEQSEARLRFMREVDDALRAARDAPAAMSAATALLARTLGASRCAYAHVAADDTPFWVRSDCGAPGGARSTGRLSLDLFGPRAVADLRAGRTLVVRDVAGELDPAEGREMLEAIGIEAIVCCPMIENGRLGAMMAVHQDRPRAWTPGEIALVEEVVERSWSHVGRVGAETRLRESEERLRLAVDNADVGFWDVDVINDVLIWPARTKAMFGISADVPVTMRDFYEGLHPSDREAIGAALAAAVDPERRALYDVDYRTIGKEDGVVRWVAAKGRGVFDASGRCQRVTGTVVEISARKQAEEALHDLNGTLEARIAEAVAERELAQEALRQSQKMEAMGQLTGGVAHDFNNLLTPIVGALDMLQRRGLGGEREQRLIAGAAQSAERAKTLVQRLLAFARRQPLQAVPVDVAQLVRNIGGLVASTTGPQIKVVIDAPADLPAAVAEPNQLEMALLNLSVNARDAMPDGGTLRISARVEPIRPGHRSKLPAGQYVCLSVADTGSGMDAATLARAVEPFFSTKGIGKGTGLGLSMVHGLASQLNGALTIQSRPGLGTNVELWLPRSSVTPVAAIHGVDVPEQGPAHGIALLVDDEDLVRASTADMLADLGYSVLEAASGEEAMQMVNGGRTFDLLVTDHLMPGVSGTDLARAVRAARPGTAILLVSGYAEREGLDPDLPRLTKPFRKDELAASLSLLGREV